MTLARHRYFLTAAYDMGFYVHDVWQIAHGNWMNNVFGFHVFADHFSPIMVLLAPLAYLSTAEGLLVVQALAIGSTVIPAFRLGQKLGGSRLGWLAVLWVGLSANVWHTFMYDFRPATLGYVALIWLIAEMEDRRRWWSIAVLCALAASSREDVAVIAGIAVLIQARIDRSWKLAGFGIGTASVGLWYSLFGQRLFASFDYFLWYRYADYGDTPLAALGDLGYTIPTALGRLFRGEVVVAVAALLLPCLVLPAFTQIRRSWPAFLIILSNAVSIDPFVPTIYYQYYLLCVAFILWGAVHAYGETFSRTKTPMTVAISLAVFFAFGPLFSFGSAPYGRSVADIARATGRQVVAAEIPELPADVSISAGNIVLPHVADRAEVYSFPLPMLCSEVVLRYTDATFFPDYIVAELNESEILDIDIKSLGYEVVDKDGRIGVWRATGQHPKNIDCPSPDVTRRQLFDRIRERAGGDF